MCHPVLSSTVTVSPVILREQHGSFYFLFQRTFSGFPKHNIILFSVHLGSFKAVCNDLKYCNACVTCFCTASHMSDCISVPRCQPLSLCTVCMHWRNFLPIRSRRSMATVSKARLIMGYSSSTSLKWSTDRE